MQWECRTVPEVNRSRHGGMEVFGVSVITDLVSKASLRRFSHEEVKKAAAKAQPKMMEIMTELVNRFGRVMEDKMTEIASWPNLD